jgi:threonyl-tRNA synthetase
MLVVGGREAEAGQVAVRHRRRGDLGASDAAEFVAKISAEIAAKSLE